MRNSMIKSVVPGAAPSKKRQKDSRGPRRWREDVCARTGEALGVRLSFLVFSGAFGSMQVDRANHERFVANARLRRTENWATRYRDYLFSTKLLNHSHALFGHSHLT